MDLLLIPDYMMDTHGLLDGIDSWGESRQLGKRKQHWVPEEAAVSKMAKSNGDQNSWEQVEELAADLDGSCSLSSLNVDLGTTTFQNGDALLSLPSLSALKQELLSPFNNNESCGEISGQTSPQHQKQIQQCYEQGMNGGVDYPVGLNSPVQSDGSNSGSNLVAPSVVPVALVSSSSVNQYSEDCRCGEVNGQTSPQRQKQIQPQCYEQGMNGAVDYQVGLHSPVQSDGSNSGSNPIVPVSLVSSGSVSQFTEDCRFQYVLAAATSIATKVNEETLTYLNQGQSYEIKLKKLGDLSEYRGKILKSVVRLVFHERRLQYMEREQLAAWEASHPGDSILEVDLPLSYGLLELSQDPARLNTIEFLWDPTKEVGVYIKVNCISTEFTPKKHGGEKGVPFRIQVETYLQGDQGVRHLHTASCQVKVFKLKGADRKHKQDREKIQKRPLLEQEKYQCSYDCTILTDVPLNGDNAFPPLLLNGNSTTLNTDMTKLRQALPITKEETSPISQSSPNHSSPCDSPLQFGGGVNASWGPQETGMWLQTNRYSAHLHTLASYSGLDLLQLTRENLIQLCGLPDGIRLYNALHPRAVSPRLTLYLSCEAGSRVYHAVYLSVATSRELVAKLASMLGLTLSQVVALYMLGPNNIRVIVSDELVSHISDQSAFAVEILTHDVSTDRYQLLLKKTNANPSN